MIRNLRELYQYRPLLWALTLRELKARYRASVLGFMWTFLNPTLNMIVYWVAFEKVLASTANPVHFPHYLFAGLLPWIFFSTSVTTGTSAVSERRDLLTKVRFPAQVLPATIVLSNAINFVLSVPLLIGLGAVYRVWPTWHLVFALPLLGLQLFFTLAITYLVSALNVAFRDLQHIMGNVMQLAFFLTPVLWNLGQVRAHNPQLAELVPYLNPLSGLIEGWRAIFYHQAMPELTPLVYIGALSVLLMLLASSIFERRREEFAELL